MTAAGAAGSGAPASPGLPPRYEVQKFLGQGAMGRVFLCRDQELDVLVAVKVLAPQYAEDPSSVEQVRAEARAVAKFRGCPSILALYGFERHEGSWYLVTEFAAGGSLDQRLKASGRLSESECRRIGGEVAEALHFAHKGLVLHRDIKPGNVLLDDRGRAKVADFGIAKILQADTAQASTMTLTGTPVYMSPEAILREPMDARSDLYSLGCMLFEMGTGRRPFSGSHFEVFLAKTAEGAVPPDPKPLAPELSDAFCSIVRQAMASSPAARFPDGLAMAAALRGVSEEEEQATMLTMSKAAAAFVPPPSHDGATIKQPPAPGPAPAAPPPPSPSPPAPAPSRSLVVPIAIGAVVLIAGAGVAALLMSGSGKKGEKPPAPPVVADDGEDAGKPAPPPPPTDPGEGPEVKAPDPGPVPAPDAGPEPGPTDSAPNPKPEPPPPASAPLEMPLAPVVDLPEPKAAAPVDAALLPKGFRLRDGRILCEKDRAEMVLVPAGTFARGSDSGLPDEKPQKEITLKGFLIDRHEVTVGQWNEFCRSAPRNDLRKPETDPRLPVTGIFHEHAALYAEWAGKRLPTEAEWERAARGTAQWSWPWGMNEDEGAAHLGDHKDPVPVATFPKDASPCGAMDMAGNVSEWCSDWYDPAYYGGASLEDPRGPVNPVEGFGRCIRGGAYNMTIEQALCVRRGFAKTEKDSKRFGKSGKDYKEPSLGFRCAADLGPN